MNTTFYRGFGALMFSVLGKPHCFNPLFYSVIGALWGFSSSNSPTHARTHAPAWDWPTKAPKPRSVFCSLSKLW